MPSQTTVAAGLPIYHSNIPPLPLHTTLGSSTSYITSNKLDYVNTTLPMSLSHRQTNDTVSAVYLYKNDPKQINKGVRIAHMIHPQGGYTPILAESDYETRKTATTAYTYNNKLDHGSRPQHKSTFNILADNSSQQNQSKNYFSTSNQADFRGLKTRPEYRQVQAEDQFKVTHFEVSEYSPQRSFNTSYAEQFHPNKHNDQVNVLFVFVKNTFQNNKVSSPVVSLFCIAIKKPDRIDRVISITKKYLILFHEWPSKQ